MRGLPYTIVASEHLTYPNDQRPNRAWVLQADSMTQTTTSGVTRRRPRAAAFFHFVALRVRRHDESLLVEKRLLVLCLLGLSLQVDGAVVLLGETQTANDDDDVEQSPSRRKNDDSPATTTQTTQELFLVVAHEHNSDCRCRESFTQRQDTLVVR